MSWPQVMLESVFEIARGGSPRPIDDYFTDAEDGLNWISIKDASNSNKFIEKTKLKIKPEGLSKTRLVKPGDFLLTNSMSFGRPYIMKTTGCIHDGWLVLSGDPEKVDSDYFYHLLGSDLLKRRFSALAAGAVVKNLNIDLVKGVEIPLPPLLEQKRIAAILDKADAIRGKRQQAIQLADDFLRAVFLDMFGDPNSNSKKADLLPMTEVFEIKTGKLNSNAATDGGEYPFFTCAKEVFSIDNYAFDQEALLLAGNNAQADYDVKYYKGRFNAYQRTYVLTLRDSGWSYPFYQFALQYQLSNLKRASKGSSTKYITLEIMERTILPVPSQGDQKRFVEYFDKVRAVQEALLVQAQNDEKLFSALSSKAFSGQL